MLHKDYPGGIAMYWRLAVVSIKAQMQYKVSFIVSIVAQFLVTIIEVAGIWALFARFGRLEHWGVADVCFFYGTVNIAFALAEAISTGFDEFGASYVRTGQFDRLLLRPRSLFVQLMGHELSLRRSGRMLQGIAILLWAIHTLSIDMTAARWALLAVTIAGSVCFFTGVFILGATLCFWSTESLELINTLTYGGVQSAQYPIAIYEAWFRKFFTYIVPLACISYFPIVAILGIDDPLGSSRTFQTLAPFSGVLFLWFTMFVFQRAGVRHYTSTGS